MEEEYEEIELECVNDFAHEVDITIYSDGCVMLHAATLDTHVSIESTKEALKEFATNILKELDNGIQR